MGITWEKPKTVKEGTLLVVKGNLPADSSELWNLRKMNVDAIKKDGFSVGKYQGSWSVSYFHTINDDSREKTTDGEEMWMAEFKRKCVKWETALGEMSDQLED